MTKVEEVARAIALKMVPADQILYRHDWVDKNWQRVVPAAHGAMDNIYRPTAAMIAAGLKAGDVDDLQHTEAEIHAIWRAMITAALSE